jgi:cell division protein FtsB
MLFVVGALMYLYISGGARWVSTWREAKRRSAAVSSLEKANARLRAERVSLGQPGVVQAEARRLGMVRPGERAYIVTGLPKN